MGRIVVYANFHATFDNRWCCANIPRVYLTADYSFLTVIGVAAVDLRVGSRRTDALLFHLVACVACLVVVVFFIF